MYDSLLQLPLFQGMCKSDFTTILEKVRFHFLSFNKGETIVRQGDPCQRLIFLLKGNITAHTMPHGQEYALSETFQAPYLIEPQSLFGRQTVFSATYHAKTEIQILDIDKAYIFSELSKYEIFRLNLLNILSSRCQYLQQKLWENHTNGMEEKFIRMLLSFFQLPYGEKTLYITMGEISSRIDETRINVSKMLNDWQKQGLLQLKRKEIYIPQLEKLCKAYEKNNPQEQSL